MKNAITKCRYASDSMIERRVLKRAARKAMRQIVKKVEKDIPKRVTQGWWS